MPILVEESGSSNASDTSRNSLQGMTIDPLHLTILTTKAGVPSLVFMQLLSFVN